MLIQRIGRIALPPWASLLVTWGTALLLALSLAVFLPSNNLPTVRVAMVGNSMQYYNDFPRFLEALSDGHVIQNSCLHGDANLRNILIWGNGMYNLWRTGSARLEVDDDDAYETNLYDFGACTVKQLLFGYDYSLSVRVAQLDQEQEDDDGQQDIDDAYLSDTDDFYTFYDGLNPCLRDPEYLNYLDDQYQQADGPPEYDFVFLNDNTRSPARNQTRDESLEALRTVYLPWFLETGATPVFLMTHAYSTPYRDMGDIDDVGIFTSLTYEGYRQYADLLEQNLPGSQKPRIAPVGLAFLLVWEENYSLWQRLFHVDQVHASNLGTFLQGCVVHHTLLGRLPRFEVAVGKASSGGDVSHLWDKTRRFQPRNHRRNPFPTQEEAAYLYNVAQRICVYGIRPKTWIAYENGEASDYTPYDDVFRNDDLF